MKITIELETENQASLESAINFIASLLPTSPLKRTGTAQKSTNAPKVIPEVTPVEKTASTVTLEQLKDLAKATVEKSDRVVVKTLISKYADKLASVKEEDYKKLFEELSKVGA